jgi:hypothetical protein
LAISLRGACRTLAAPAFSAAIIYLRDSWLALRLGHFAALGVMAAAFALLALVLIVLAFARTAQGGRRRQPCNPPPRRRCWPASSRAPARRLRAGTGVFGIVSGRKI